MDPDANLGLALGFSEEELDSIVPISKMRKLVEERTEATPDNRFYKLNPKVDDIPEKYGRTCNGVKLLVLGTVETANSGCVCPEHVMLKRIINNLVLHRDDVVILDMEAGLEHLGRGHHRGHGLLCGGSSNREPEAYRPTKTSSVWRRAWASIRFTWWPIRVRDEKDEAFIREKIPAEDLLGMVHYNEQVIDADRQGCSPYDFSQQAVSEIRAIKEKIDKTNM